MMRKHPRQEMVKASLWMHKDEYNKLIELSGHASLNFFMMQIIRDALAAKEGGKIER